MPSGTTVWTMNAVIKYTPAAAYHSGVKSGNNLEGSKNIIV